MSQLWIKNTLFARLIPMKEGNMEQPSDLPESVEPLSEVGEYIFVDRSQEGSPVMFKCNANTREEAEKQFKDSGEYRKNDVGRTFVSD